MDFISIGHSNSLPIDECFLILKINSKPIKKLISHAGIKNRLYDTANNRKRKSVIFTSDSYIVLSSLTTKTLFRRFKKQGGDKLGKIISIGYDNFIPLNKIAMILKLTSHGPAPTLKKFQDYKDEDKGIDATYGKKTNSLIVTTNGYLVSTALESKKIMKLCNKNVDKSEERFVDIGNDNFVPMHRIEAMVASDSRPIKDLIEKSKTSGKLFYVNAGIVRQSALITTDGFVVLSALPPKKIVNFYNKEIIKGEKEKIKKENKQNKSNKKVEDLEKN